MNKSQSPSRTRIQKELEKRKAYYKAAIKDSEQSKSPHKAENIKYFCHYNNAVYMGGMTANQRNGKGILLHDDGSAVICEHISGVMTGHNIIFRYNSLTSILDKSINESEVVYKFSKTLLKLVLKGSQPHGDGMLIDYQYKKLYSLVYKKGKLKHKTLILSKIDNEDVFQKNKLKRLIGAKHYAALKFNFELPEGCKVQYDKRRVSIGYCDNNGELSGLAFQMYLENNIEDYNQPFYMKTLYRGFYRYSKLYGFGYTFFSNYNRYVGEFYNDYFSGLGFFLNPIAMKWIFGKFAKGQLLYILYGNNNTFKYSNFQVWNHCLYKIHHHKRDKWINEDILLLEEWKLLELSKEGLDLPNEDVEEDSEEEKRKEKEQIWFIQKEFLEGEIGSRVTMPTISKSVYRREKTANQLGKIIMKQSSEYEYYDSKQLPKKAARPYTKNLPKSEIKMTQPKYNSLNSNVKPVYADYDQQSDNIAPDHEDYYRKVSPFKLDIKRVPQTEPSTNHKLNNNGKMPYDEYFNLREKTPIQFYDSLVPVYFEYSVVKYFKVDFQTQTSPRNLINRTVKLDLNRQYILKNYYLLYKYRNKKDVDSIMHYILPNSFDNSSLPKSLIASKLVNYSDYPKQPYRERISPKRIFNYLNSMYPFSNNVNIYQYSPPKYSLVDDPVKQFPAQLVRKMMTDRPEQQNRYISPPRMVRVPYVSSPYLSSYSFKNYADKNSNRRNRLPYSYISSGVPEYTSQIRDYSINSLQTDGRIRPKTELPKKNDFIANNYEHWQP